MVLLISIFKPIISHSRASNHQKGRKNPGALKNQNPKPMCNKPQLKRKLTS